MIQQRIAIIDAALDELVGKEFFNRTLARKIVTENPGAFERTDKEIENVRKMIRNRRGSNGKIMRKSPIVRPEFKRDEMKPSEYMAQFTGRSLATEPEVWKLPEEIRKPLIISDLHMPYHAPRAIDTTLDYGFKHNADAIYINGDLIDFYKISRWQKDPRGPNVQVEIDMVREFLELLDGLGLPIFWKMGNHEDRWNNYLIQNAPELLDLDALQMANVLDLESLDIELIGSTTRSEFGHLTVIHGHEFGQSFFNPVNPARGLFLRAKTSTIAGHNHQTSAHHENNLSGKQTACFSTGCLCSLTPDYRPYAYTKWNHGAAIITLDEDGYFSVNNFRIMNDKVV